MIEESQIRKSTLILKSPVEFRQIALYASEVQSCREVLENYSKNASLEILSSADDKGNLVLTFAMR